MTRLWPGSTAALVVQGEAFEGTGGGETGAFMVTGVPDGGPDFGVEVAGATVVLGTSISDGLREGTDDATESKDCRYCSAGAGSLLLFADGELVLSGFGGSLSREAFGADPVFGGILLLAVVGSGSGTFTELTEPEESTCAGGDATGLPPRSFSNSVNCLSVSPGPSPISTLPEKSLTCEFADVHPLPIAKSTATASTVQATAHMAFTIPPSRHLVFSMFRKSNPLFFTPGPARTP